jgi:hypothetical protein
MLRKQIWLVLSPRGRQYCSRYLVYDVTLASLAVNKSHAATVLSRGLRRRMKSY